MPSGDESNKRCAAAAIALSIAQVLTVIGTDYQVYPLDGLRIDYLFFVNHAIFLSPVVLLLLIRRWCIFVGLYGIPIVIIFISRMQNVFQFYWFGTNSMATQKSDAVGFLNMLFDILSIKIAAVVALVIFASKLFARIQR